MKELASIKARGNSIILQLESERWETRAATLDSLDSRDIEENIMLVLERVDDEDSSVRCAAVDALLRLNARYPATMARFCRFVALKLQKDDRPIQLLALELLLELDAAAVMPCMRKVRRLEDDRDPAVRAAAKRVRIKCECHAQGQAEADAVAIAAQSIAMQYQQPPMPQQQQPQRRRRMERERQLARARVAVPRTQITRYRVNGRAVPVDAGHGTACSSLPQLIGARGVPRALVGAADGAVGDRAECSACHIPAPTSDGGALQRVARSQADGRGALRDLDYHGRLPPLVRGPTRPQQQRYEGRHASL